MSETKECPYCAETIKAAAIKCRYWSSDLKMLPSPTRSTKIAGVDHGSVEVLSTLTGYGDQLVPLTGGGAVFARLKHGGSGNFAVWSLTEDGFQSDLLVNHIGRYEGPEPAGLTGRRSRRCRPRPTGRGSWTCSTGPVCADGPKRTSPEVEMSCSCCPRPCRAGPAPPSSASAGAT